MLKCQICQEKFNDQVEAGRKACKDGGGHILQEVLIGSINPDDGSRADFISVGASERAKWAEEARRVFGDDTDSY